MRRKFVFTLIVLATLNFSQQRIYADTVATSTISFAPLTVSGDTFDSLVMEWSTPVMSGVINDTALSTLTFSIFDGNSLVYQDIAIQNGVEQPIGGVARGPGGIDFHFDIDSVMFVPEPGGGDRSWDNDVNVQQFSSVGTTWNVFADLDGQSIRFAKFFDGSLDVVGTTTSFDQSTVFAVPEPSSVGLLAVFAFGCLVRRRR